MTRWLLRLLVLAGLGFVAWKVWQLVQEDEDHSAEWAAARSRVGEKPAAAAPALVRPARPPTEAVVAEHGGAGSDRGAGEHGRAGRDRGAVVAEHGGTGSDRGAEENGGADAAWVKPDGSTCPPGYPVKAKTGSKVYRVPGMFSYEESKPERCYRDEAAAVADGFTRAKR